ncbi:MAG: hydrogenase [Deltaproteobacteria bacterium]|jgi:Ni,Fe-hydrogenase III large subunit|nr:hydrogenase [Deltaproteobacteria bacterium]
MAQFITLTNGGSCPAEAVPVLRYDDFAACLKDEVHAGAGICSFFGVPHARQLRLYIVLVKKDEATLAAGAMDVGQSYAALTPEFPALHLFEREIYEQFSVLPQGHSRLKPVRFDGTDSPQVGDMDFFKAEGNDVHEVAVGPIHAGVIECGHFRFQCLGEIVLHLEISLGYHHRGLEACFNQNPQKNALPLMETLAGDSSIAHAWAFSTLRESLNHTAVTRRAQTIRAIALELERLANHTGDLGALAGDMGYLPTASFCGRLRGDFLNMTAMLCGNRFGRGLVAPGGVNFDLEEALCLHLEKKLRPAARDVYGAVDLLWETPSVTSRMMEIGVVPEQAARDLGLAGPAARASGLRRDVRITHPLPGLQESQLTMQVEKSGDVYARARIRLDEIHESVSFILRELGGLHGQAEPLRAGSAGAPGVYGRPSTFGAALVEGWRGEICHTALTDAAGRLQRYKIVDPSFRNWIGLALAMRGGQISDFPLCNKSFNLSYCGVDL